MAVTPSKNNNIGFKAPYFKLNNVISDKLETYQELKGDKATVVMFICNHCPFVIHLIKKTVDITNKYKAQGINFIAICSNDIINYPDDSPENMKLFAKKYEFRFPYLYDETQEIAKAYGAECTPEFLVFNNSDLCVYRGQFDDSRPKNGIEVSGNSLSKAINSVINDEKITEPQVPSIGCSIKWKN